MFSLAFLRTFLLFDSIYSLLIMSQVCSRIRCLPCNEQSLERCLAPVLAISENASLAFPVNYGELNITCRLISKSHRCNRQYLKACTGESFNGMYREIISGPTMLFRTLCTDGKVQKDLFSHGHCYRAATQSDRCKEREAAFFSAIEDVKRAAKSGESTDPQGEDLRKYCCGLQGIIDCQTRLINRTCGSEATRFFTYYQDKMTAVVLTEHCSNFLGKCSWDLENLQETEERETEKGKTGPELDPNGTIPLFPGSNSREHPAGALTCTILLLGIIFLLLFFGFLLLICASTSFFNQIPEINENI